MILRIDRLQTELPPPSDPDPVGASAVQELLGGKFGEMSTFMNYTYQSFNFRNRQGARPFYDLLASIARVATTTCDQEVAELLFDVLGARGLEHSAFEDHWRYAQAATISSGTIEMQRMLIARAALGSAAR